MSFWLEHDQDGQRQKYPFDAPSITVGRDQSADFLLDHPTVSRQHARIVSQGSSYRLVVLSQGGLTAINGSAVNGEVNLTDGATLQFGQFSFVFRTETAARPSGGFGAPPASGGFGAPPAGGGFGAPPAGGGFGTPPAGGGFGTPPAGGGFGTPPAGGGFGAPPAGGGFGTPPAGGSFGTPPSSGGFGAPPASSGFGSPPSSGGFGKPPGGSTPPASGGFGGPGSGGFGAPASGFGTPPSGGFGTPPSSGGFGAPSGFGAPVGSDAKAPRDDNHIVSWDEIAQSEEALGGKAKAETDFERLEAAQKKARDGAKKPNPLLLVVLLFAVLGTGAFVLYEPPKGTKVDEPGTVAVEPLRFQANEVDCVGEAECLAKAQQHFIVANELSQKIEVDIRNRFDAYFKYELALEMLKKGGVDPPPASFSGIHSSRDRLRGELDTMFQQRRVRYHDLSKRKMYREMVAILNEVQATFPYKGAREYIWAVQLERQLKDQNLYPSQF